MAAAPDFGTAAQPSVSERVRIRESSDQATLSRMGATDAAGVGEKIGAASDEEIFAFIDNEL